MNCDRLALNEELVLFGNDGKSHTDVGFDFILLHAKFHVNKCRLNKIKPSVQTFLNELKYIHRIDEHVYKLDMSYGKFLLKWFPYSSLVD